MPVPDGRLERDLAGFVRDLQEALGDALVSVSLYGSAAADDWVPGQSDVNTIVVVRAVSGRLLDVLAALLPPWRRRGFALPLVVDEEFLDRARDSFPMEFDDLRRAHRPLAGTDVLAGLTVDRAHLRRQCEQEARAKLLRLRALYLDAAARPEDLERLLTESLKSFLVILRHVLHLRGEHAPHGYDEVLTAGERLLGPLPAFRRVFEHRRRKTRLGRADFSHYLADAERVVASVDTVHA